MCLYPFFRATSTAFSTAPGADFHVPAKIAREHVRSEGRTKHVPRPRVGILAPVFSVTYCEAGMLALRSCRCEADVQASGSSRRDISSPRTFIDGAGAGLPWRNTCPDGARRGGYPAWCSASQRPAVDSCSDKRATGTDHVIAAGPGSQVPPRGCESSPARLLVAICFSARRQRRAVVSDLGLQWWQERRRISRERQSGNRTARDLLPSPDRQNKSPRHTKFPGKHPNPIRTTRH